tara:strand:+ start:4731 stop:5006 length:276 start_codon:yes stop_codon:yes gene_type:complete
MKRLLFIALALIIPIIIWWVESKIAKRKGDEFSGPSVLMLFGIAASIFILIVGLLLSQTTNAPSGSEYFPARVENGKVISGGFKENNSNNK